jgi:signal transduction histidine kinase
LARVQHLERKQEALQAAREELESVVRNRTRELAQTNISLKREVDDHKQTAVKLEQRTKLLENEIEERKRMELENERVQQQLLETSREAGMAEVATSVLHNVGNVLNSVNVSAGLLAEQLRKSKVSSVNRVAALLEENRHNLAAYLAEPGRADQIIQYLKALGQQFAEEHSAIHEELRQLTANIEHIKKIVAMQQSYARVGGVTEEANPIELVEDSLRMDLNSLTRNGIEIVRQFEPVPSMVVDKNKVLQILINLIRNARHACDESARPDKRLIVQVRANGGGIQIVVEDNGVGIPTENLTRIFNHGFTTRKNGHGFGLHSGALAAREMGGALIAFSGGPGTGARFLLELPLQPSQNL